MVYVLQFYPTCADSFPKTAEHQGCSNEYHTWEITTNLEEGRRGSHNVEGKRRMESLEWITHGVECRFNRAVQAESEGRVFDAVTRTSQGHKIRGVH